MNRKVWITKAALVLLALVLLLMLPGCPSPTGTNGTNGDDAYASDPPKSKSLVAAGIALMKLGDWDGAYGKFTEAVYWDASNGEAVIWYSMCHLAALSVDENLQDLMSSKIGVVGYPGNMNDAFGQTWLTQYVYSSYPDPAGYFPEIEIPMAIAEWEDGDPAIITLNEYFLALANNIIARNATGFNELVDAVVDDVLGARLDDVIASIQAVPKEGTQIVFTGDMFSVFGGGDVPDWWPTDGADQPYDIVIGKAELLLEAAALELVKSLLLLGKVYNLTLPIGDYWAEFNPIDVDYSDFDPNTVDWSDVLSPFADPYRFLYPREDTYAATLTAAKAAASGAFQKMLDAIDMIQDRGTDSGFTIAEDSNIPDIGDIWEDFEAGMLFEEIFIGMLQDSLSSGDPVFFPVNFNDFSGPGAYYEYYIQQHALGNWPDEPDWGSMDDPDTPGDESEPPTVVGCGFGVLYSSPFGAINYLLALEDNGEPEWYRFTVTDQDPDPLLTRDSDDPVSDIANPLEEAALYAFKLKDLTLGGLIVVDNIFFADLKEDMLEFLTLGMDYDFDSDFIVESPDGSITVYVPIVPPFIAYNSFADANEDFDVDGKPFRTRGTFWFAIPDLVEWFDSL